HPEGQAQGRHPEVQPRARGPLPVTSTPALAGQVAIVTGASRGLGRSIALALAAAGAAVAVAARSKADLEETAGLVQHAGRRGLAIPTDVTRYTEVEDRKSGVEGKGVGA